MAGWLEGKVAGDVGDGWVREGKVAWGRSGVFPTPDWPGMLWGGADVSISAPFRWIMNSFYSDHCMYDVGVTYQSPAS